MLNTSYGFQGLLKEGSRHYSGLDESIFKNVEACKDLADLTKTSLGPYAMRKLIVNHIDKIFVTSDAATIMKELEVNHPAAKMIVMAAKQQESECGDATNLVISFAGELLNQAEGLIRMGLHSSQIILGYEAALKETLRYIESLNHYEVSNVRDTVEIAKLLRSVISPKLQGFDDLFAKIVAEACVRTLPRDPKKFEVEYIRVAKLLGGNVNDSFVIGGLILTRGSETSIHQFNNPKIAVFSCPLDTQEGDTKGTVLIKNANDLLNYTKSEENLAEKCVKEIAEAGVNVIVAGGSISEIVLHYIEKYKMMAVKVQSKFELKRLCKCLGATALVRLGAPIPEELGTCDEVVVQEIGSQKVTLFRRDDEDAKLATIVLRGATTNLLDDIERAIDDAVCTYKNLIKDPSFVAGAGATEMALYCHLEEEASKITGLEQYSYNKFAKAFEIIPRILSDNSGLNTNDILTKLYSANSGEKTYGIDIEGKQIRESSALGVYDLKNTKLSAIKLGADAAITILRIDQIIVAKPAGGPKPRDNKNWDEDQ
eukprot:TRINITY_DN1072_c0_g2_i10.p1 TRINITY_DN1072_c0_g2~~TRINITY_DN1072_c0_g2_i10.p1  ORF type:complete len:541 (+),score=198.85 TRINITY_DN1072_c0_g2_i10:156-1778(+)